MLTRVHVNQHNIKHNRKTGENVPVLTVKTYKDNHYANEVIIQDKDGVEVVRVVYKPEHPLSCGAQVWIETNNSVEVI